MIITDIINNDVFLYRYAYMHILVILMTYVYSVYTIYICH